MAGTLTRDSAFSYRCNACSRCCHGKKIAVNPYEVARLAGAHGIDTGAFIDRFVEPDGPWLETTSDGACVFLGPAGCTVHPDRPLVCRLYPLGRHVAADGGETFSTVTPHPETEGIYGEDGTVGDFLRDQQTDAFIMAADAYHAAVNELLGLIGDRATTLSAAESRIWLDIDYALDEHGGDGIDDLGARMRAHIEILRARVQTLIEEEDGDDRS